MKYFKLPDLGEGLQEAEIVEWHIKPGAAVTTGQIILSVETAKAIVEVPSPEAGVIAKLFGEAGDIIHTGEPLLAFEGEGDDSGTVEHYEGEGASADVSGSLAERASRGGLLAPPGRDGSAARVQSACMGFLEEPFWGEGE